jgi:hypothetical protein
MERRGGERTRLRLPTEIVYDGARHHGFLVDVSARGGFVQTPRTLPPGSEIELWFADDQLAPQRVRARVARRRSVPAAAAVVMRSGIGVEWIEPPAFLRALAQPLAIEIVVDVEAPTRADDPESRAGEAMTGPATPASHGSNPEPIRESEPAVLVDETDGASIIESAAPWRAASGSDATAESVTHGEIVRVGPAPLAESTLDLTPTAVRAEVAIIDEGELGELEALIQALGAHTLRMRWGAQADPLVWEAPPRVVVVSARVALAVPLGEAVLGARAVGIAVCDSDAQTLRARLRRQGYELALQRHAHPETLRLLFASLLARRPERRKQRRRPFGALATFWQGLRRMRALLLEISPAGASLLVPRQLPRGTRLTLRVSARAAGSALGLPCEVVRSSPGTQGAEARVGLRFAKLSSRQRARVDALVKQLDSSGPIALAKAQAVASTPAPGPSERRRGTRARLSQQALALDPGSGVASDVLFATELSLGGLRIEPHPRLARGTTLLLALQPSGGATPLMLRAEVARDEGARGLVLRFVAPSSTDQQAIDRMLEAAAEIERTRERRDERAARVVLGRLVEAETPAH